MANQIQEQPKPSTPELNLDLAAPDRFQKSAGAGLDYLRDRRGPLFTLGALIVTGAVVYLVVSWLFSNTREKAGDKLAWISDVAQRPLDKEGMPVIPEKNTGRPALLRYSSEAEKQKGLLDEFRKFQREYSGTAGTTAKLGESSILFDQGDFAKAGSGFQEVAKTDLPPAILALVRENAAYALEMQGNIDGAIAAFEVLSRDDPKGFYADNGKYHVARLLEKKGDKDKAIATYEAIIKEFPKGAAAGEAEKRLRALGVEPPKTEEKEKPAVIEE